MQDIFFIKKCNEEESMTWHFYETFRFLQLQWKMLKNLIKQTFFGAKKYQNFWNFFDIDE